MTAKKEKVQEVEIMTTDQPAAAVSAVVTPMDLIIRGKDENASIEQMEKLFDLQLRYEDNEAKKAFHESMSSFRAECPEIKRTRKGHNNKYAGLAESIKQIKAVMAKHGLSHSWRTEQTEKQIAVTCVLTHRQGHSEETTLSAEADISGKKNPIQSIGSTVSYLERYTLYAMLGLASSEMDDDGNGSGDSGDEIIVITDNQWRELDTMIDQVGAKREDFCAFYKIDDIARLPVTKFKQAMSGLEAKREKEKTA